MIAFRAGMLALASLVCASAPALAERPPNVVLIYTDDQGYGDIGCFGAKGFSTPNIDRLATEGRKFTNFHVSQPVCSASRAALLTGCYSNRIGIHGALGPNAKVGISDGEVTIAQMLKTKGYATGMAGKWHLGRPTRFLPTHHGFDEYLGLPYSNDMWPRHPEAKSGTYPPLPLIEGDKVVDAEVTPDDMRQLTTRYTERAVSFIERNKDAPFFFYLAHSMPHVPLAVSDKFRGKSERGLYGDVMMEIDWSVGEVLKTLRANGLDKDTLVIFATDNGPWLSYGDHAGGAGPLREGKGTVWEGGVRVPCLMRWPGKIPSGTESDAMLMTLDLFPTLAKIVGAKLPSHTIDGLDVWPLISGEPGATNPHDAYLYYFNQNQLQAVVSGDGRWKLQLPHEYVTLEGRPGGRDGVPAKYAWRTIDAPALYDLRDDRGETTDVASQHPHIVSRLLDVAERARADLGDSLTKRVGSGIRPAGQVDDAKADEGLSGPIRPKEVTPLFNGKDLSGLSTWLKDGGKDDPRRVFRADDGMLHIGGDGFGYVATREEYRDYRLVLEFRWGQRTDGGKSVRNSGLLMHATGPDGNAGGLWMASVECQLAQGCVGDLIPIPGKSADGSSIPVKFTSDVVLGPDDRPRWKDGGTPREFTGGQLWWSKHDPDFKELIDTRGKDDVESPLGEWTRVECLCEGDKIEVRVNGTLVNKAYGVSPAAGKILLQSEGFELFVRKFELHPLSK